MAINIPENLQRPHDEINEDGKTFRHPGYTVAKCQVAGCGRDCIAAVGAPVANCGQHDGDHKNHFRNPEDYKKQGRNG